MVNRKARVAVIVAAAMSPISILAQQRSFITPGLTLQPKKPIRKPFVFRIPTPLPAASSKQLDAKTTVICGMTVIHPDQTIDPEIAKKPLDSKTTFTLRIVPPPACASP
jgi:hypothetical protein